MPSHPPCRRCAVAHNAIESYSSGRHCSPKVKKRVAFNNEHVSQDLNEPYIPCGGHRMLFQMDRDSDETASSSSGDVGVDLTGEYECFKGSIVFYPDANLYHLNNEDS